MAKALACEPEPRCARCPRLAAYRARNRRQCSSWHNAPVTSFGEYGARLLIVGLAPGLKGANRTGRAFTGDASGEFLFAALRDSGFAKGIYGGTDADGVELEDCMISNAVRCVPPHNKPTPDEIARCRPFLAATIAAMPRLRALLALGRVAHDSTLRALGCKASLSPFSHGARHEITARLTLFDSFHCSRYNTNTGRLTPAMFTAVFENIRTELVRRH